MNIATSSVGNVITLCSFTFGYVIIGALILFQFAGLSIAASFVISIILTLILAIFMILLFIFQDKIYKRKVNKIRKEEDRLSKTGKN